MTEDPQIIGLYIRHYQELLKLDRHTAETRQHLIELLAEAQAQLPLAESRGVATRFVNFHNVHK
jgi:hypothetical protein